MKKILIVDDVAENRYILDVLLTTNGYEVIEASNGKEALELARKAPPDLIITDILMPVMDGFSLCRAWKSEAVLQDIPLIIYTATYTDPRDKQLAIEIGADLFLVKPLEPDDILENIHNLLLLQKEKRTEKKEIPIENHQFISEYNEALIRKLEDKMLQLQKNNSRVFSLYNLSNLLSLLKSEDESIHEVVTGLVEKAGYPNAIYLSADKSQSALHLKDSCGVANEILAIFKNEANLKMDVVLNDPNWPAKIPDLRSVLIIPVQNDDKIFGVLLLSSSELAAFSEEDQQIVRTLANNLAICLLNCTNEQQIQDQFKKLSSLHKIDLSITSCTDLNLTLTLLLNFVISLLKVDAADVLLLNSDTLSCRQVFAAGFIKEIHTPIKEQSHLWKKVVRERSILFVSLLSESAASEESKQFWKTEELVAYWGIPIIAKGKVKGILEVYKRSQFQPDSEWLNFFETMAGQAAIAVENSENFEGLINSNTKLVQAYDATIKGWSEALDLRDRETLGHTQRVTEMAIRFAKRLKLSEAEIVNIQRGAILHDIGKICLPDNILFKTGPLNNEEWQIMCKHPEIAYNLLHKIDYLQKAIDIPYCHHERWDGEGYPRKLKGLEIPLSARFFAIIDVWDALLSERPYRKAWPPEKVREYIHQNAGLHFDPELVPIFFEMLDAKSEP